MKKLYQILCCLLVFVINFGAIMPSGNTSPDLLAPETQALQIVFVTDVSGSMGYYVLSKELPADLAIMRNRLDEIMDSPHYDALTARIRQIMEDPQYIEASKTYENSLLNLTLWLEEHGYLDLDTLQSEFEKQLSSLGCNSSGDVYYDIIDGKDLNLARQTINDLCKYATVTQQQKDDLLKMVAYLEDPEFLALRENRNKSEENLTQVKNNLGFEASNKELTQYLAISSYYDMEARINLRAKELGYPNRMDLAKQTAQIIVDLSRLDQISNNRQSYFSLVKFSNLSKLIQPITGDYDQMIGQIQGLGFFGGTNIGAGLQKALDELQENGDPQIPTAIILLSDGQANTGMTPKEILTQILPQVQARNIKICSVGFGNHIKDIDEDLLRALAEGSGGQFAFAQTGDELVSFYTACRQHMVADTVTQISGLARGGETVEAGNIQVADQTDLLEITLTYISGEMEMTLVDPTGKVVDASYPGVNIEQKANVQLITLANPQPSQWVVRVQSRQPKDQSDIYNITIGSKINPTPATPTSAPTPTEALPVPTSAPPAEPPTGSSSLLAIAGTAFGVFLILAAVAGTLGLLYFLRQRRQSVRPVHILLISSMLVLDVACGLGLILATTLFNRDQSPVAFLQNAFSTSTPTPTETNTPTPSSTFTPTASPSPTITLTPTPTETPIPTPTPIPVQILASNIDQLAMAEIALDNHIVGFESSTFWRMDMTEDGSLIAADGYYCPTSQCAALIKILQVTPFGIIPLRNLLDPQIALDEWIGLDDLSFSPSGREIASAWGDQKIRIWDVQDGNLLHILGDHTGEINSIDYSPDGKLLASASDDKKVKLWDADTGQLVSTISAANAAIFEVAFSPDSSLLAITAKQRDAFLKLWRVADGRVERTLSGHTNSVFSLAFSPDGRLLASANSDGNVLVHEVESGRLLYTLKGHQGYVYGLSFSPDSSLLASGGSDQKVNLWDMATGKLLRTLDEQDNKVYSVLFAPDGSYLLVGSWFDALMRWAIKP